MLLSRLPAGSVGSANMEYGLSAAAAPPGLLLRPRGLLTALPALRDLVLLPAASAAAAAAAAASPSLWDLVLDAGDSSSAAWA